jgi:alkanesulfonate monooxygenase SsuD/methylene tetrahydromethanopterin reductase-like flavin-dependent oxidoreductase (luciferase family)
VREVVHVSADPERHVAWLQEYLALGVDALYLHHVGPAQEGFVDVFGAQVLPELRGSSR